MQVDKPIVDIIHASIVPWGGYKILVGTPLNHPRERLNGEEITSSAIVSVEDDTVETRNTIYKVLSWYDGA